MNTNNRFRWSIPWMMVVFTLLASGCAGEGAAPTQPADTKEPIGETAVPATATPAPTASPEVVEVTMPPQMTPERPIDPYTVSLAVDDLAQSLGVPVEAVQLVKYEEVTWGDPSLGCPQPGMAYIQVPVDGALIILQYGDTQYEYHSGGDRPPFLCQPGLSTYKENPPGLEIPPPGGGIDK